MTTTVVRICDINFTESPKVRDSLNGDVVKDYSASYLANAEMPPPLIYQCGNKMLIADGRHRTTGAKEAGLDQVMCEVRVGSEDDCYRAALSANDLHGLRRTCKDKRACVETALSRFPTMSNKGLAELCHVSDSLVADVRLFLESTDTVAPAPVRHDTRGRSIRVRVAAPKPAKPAPEAPRANFESSPTIGEVKFTAATRDPNHKPPRSTDALGLPIPKAGLPYWERRNELSEIVMAIGKIKSRLNRAIDDRDKLFHGCNFNRAMAAISDLQSNVAAAMPYAVCPECQGHPEIRPSNHCAMCGGKALVSKFYWDHFTNDEARQMREKVISSRNHVTA